MYAITLAHGTKMLRTRQKLGKYRLERKLGEGGFAVVWQAHDMVEGIRVALKIPHPHLVSESTLEDFRREVRLAARLDHPNILPLKNASFIDDHFVIAFVLGERTLEERLRTRLSLKAALDYLEQLLEAVSFAHEQHIIHCDIKPDNLLIFPGDRLRLTDFGIAKVAQQTVRGSGSGTMGYIAPEQAMGRPSFRSDVFSIGLVMFRTLAGRLPEWPFDWPPPGYDRLQHKLHPDMINLLRKSLEVDAGKRFRDAGAMLAQFRRLKPRTLRYTTRQAATTRRNSSGDSGKPDWQTVRRQQFLRQYGKLLETSYRCNGCDGPVSEMMRACPWCGKERRSHRDASKFSARCTRCRRGMKLDWKFCPWCFGPGFQPHTNRALSDKRYSARCGNPECTRKDLMPWMRYCPWCRRKVVKKWRIAGQKEKCPSCQWGVLGVYWSYCPWCSKSLART